MARSGKIRKMIEIELRGLNKTFYSNQHNRQVLTEIDLIIAKSKIVAIRGDNGCGKTTLLNIIAGIEAPTGGTVHFNGGSRAALRVGYTQQDYTSSLLPWFDVLDNVAVPLRLRGISVPECRQRAEHLLDSLGFNALPGTAYPHQLSGGQKQRVAVARALIPDPQLLLLDEPFANLDAHTSRDLQETLSRIHATKQPTIIYVSHELDHCIYLADRVLLLHGTPARVVCDFEVPLPRPRTREMLLGSAYAEIRSRILAEEERLYAKAR
jgi:NitT/TauT family transport system ATP-binding protein